MPDQSGFCTAEWQAAKKSFEAKTDKKKPTKKFLGFRLGTAIEKDLKEMDKIYAGISKEAKLSSKAKLIAAYDKTLSSFKKARVGYKATLVKAAKDEEATADLLKEIAVLSKTLSSIESGATSNLDTQRSVYDRQLQDEKEGAPDAAYGADGKKKQDPRILRDTAKNMASSLKSAIKFGTLFAAKVKAEPTEEMFNKEIQSAARKISQNLVNIPKIYKATGNDMGVDVKKAATMGKILDTWGKGSRKLSVPDNPTDSDPQKVLRELGAYVQILAATKDMQKQLEKAGK